MELTNRLDAAVAGRRFTETVAGRIALTIAASLLVAACAHASVPLWFTPVPLTLSDFAVLLVGLALGPELGFAALALYLLEGVSGAPVFSPKGPGGIAQVVGPTGGYLMAYPFAAAAAGWLFRLVGKARFSAALAGACAGSALLMTAGVLWLGFFAHLSASAAFRLGALPFLPGQVVKVFAAAGIALSVNRLRRR